jgi:hypothetical protein
MSNYHLKNIKNLTILTDEHDGITINPIILNKNCFFCIRPTNEISDCNCKKPMHNRCFEKYVSNNKIITCIDCDKNLKNQKSLVDTILSFSSDSSSSPSSPTSPIYSSSFFDLSYDDGETMKSIMRFIMYIFLFFTLIYTGGIINYLQNNGTWSHISESFLITYIYIAIILLFVECILCSILYFCPTI